MHAFLRSIGFKSYTTKKSLKELTDWVTDKPDRMSVVATGEDSNLTVAEREIAGHAGVAVVGEINEHGDLIPEYYFPYINSTHISSDARLSFEHDAGRSGLIGMCEDYRMGMALIFTVKNMVDVMRCEFQTPSEASFSRVCFSALASDGTVILPVIKRDRVLKQSRRDDDLKAHQSSDGRNGSEEDFEAFAQSEMSRIHDIMSRARNTDILTLVESFFMPHGMASDQYYLMGEIKAQARIENELTREHFYRILLETNGMELTVAVNERDLLGVPEVGCRLKCHVWLMGDLKK